MRLPPKPAHRQLATALHHPHQSPFQARRTAGHGHHHPVIVERPLRLVRRQEDVVALAAHRMDEAKAVTMDVQDAFEQILLVGLVEPAAPEGPITLAAPEAAVLRARVAVTPRVPALKAGALATATRVLAARREATRAPMRPLPPGLTALGRTFPAPARGLRASLMPRDGARLLPGASIRLTPGGHAGHEALAVLEDVALADELAQHALEHRLLPRMQAREP